MSDKKIKILTISDHPLSPSGVGTQTKYFIAELIKTGKYQFISLGGALKHENYNPVKVEEFGDDWIIHPVDGYGSQDLIRSIVRTQRPDILWFMTDPRFYGWLWEIENEIRPHLPMVYYHVWDNFPYPTFNKAWYDSNDAVATISKLTSDIVRTVSPGVKEQYIPHAVPTEIFNKIPDNERRKFRKEQFGIGDNDFLLFWNSRNARRKQSGSLMFWYKDFLNEFREKYPDNKAILLMHTDPKDPNGQDLVAISDEIGLSAGDFYLSTQKLPPQHLSLIYNAADVTLGISDAEGFGLSTFESLACATPIIVTMTGGLQEQVTKLSEVSQASTLERNNIEPSFKLYEHGIGIEPQSKAIIGSQEVPFIYEDRINGKSVSEALMTMYELGNEEREKLGLAGQKHVQDNYNFKKYANSWDNLMQDVHDTFGSWETRKNYNSWELIEV